MMCFSEYESFFMQPIIKFSIALTCLLVNTICAAQTPEDEPQPGFAKLTTNLGEIVFRLRADKAPASVKNFIEYAEGDFYSGTVFHRVVENFVVQGGGYTAALEEKPTQAPIKNEADNMLPNKRGAVAMARTMDPHSATSQFFINVQDNMALDHAGKYSSNAWGYAVFAEVVSGMDVVDQMRIVQVGAGGPLPSNVPTDPIVIEAVELLEELPSEPSEPESSVVEPDNTTAVEAHENVESDAGV